jgi:4-hydroxybenzoyl-CoA reductase subunit alpha
VQLDKIAARLGLNPLDIRRGHLIRPYSRTANHLSVTTTALDACLDAVAERSGFRARYGTQAVGKGLGLATGAHITGAAMPIYANKLPHASVQVSIDRGGGIVVYTGSTDIGQGSDTMLAMLVAETLGVALEHVRVVSSDTDITPVDLGSFASRVTLMTGGAAVQAAERLKGRLLETAAAFFGVPAAGLVARHDTVYRADDPAKRMGFPELVKLAEAKHGALSATGNYTPPYRGGSYRGSAIGASPTYSYSACVVAVDVDCETGEIAIDKVWISHDLGRAINPTLVEGQIQGSVYMAIGEALMETCQYRRGLPKAVSMLDYKSPTFVDMPEIEVILIESADPDGPFGAKETSQGPLLPVIPAIANAIHDAVGVRIDETPITAEKVLKALEQKAAGGAGRMGPHAMPEVRYPSPVRTDSKWGEAVPRTT